MKNSKIVIFAIVLACAMLFASVTVLAGSFTDVPEGAYYEAAAERMAEKGILSGYGDGYYYGSQTVTRAQIAALVCKLLDKVDEAIALAGKTQFADIPETSWCTGYVNYAAANKIINGDGDGNFRPDDEVKYEEVIKVIVCVLEPNNTIVVDPADWSKNFIAEGEKLGLTEKLIGEKGKPMLRSDIAVIADAAYTNLEKAEPAGTTTTKKPTVPIKPIITTTTEEPEATTEPVPVVTTEATTVSPPPPPGPNEGPEDD